MAKQAHGAKCEFYLSEPAKSMHRAVQAAVEDFLTNAENICPFFRMKLKYADTDLLKLTSATKRLASLLHWFGTKNVTIDKVGVHFSFHHCV